MEAVNEMLHAPAATVEYIGPLMLTHFELRRPIINPPHKPRPGTPGDPPPPPKPRDPPAPSR